MVSLCKLLTKEMVINEQNIIPLSSAIAVQNNTKFENYSLLDVVDSSEVGFLVWPLCSTSRNVIPVMTEFKHIFQTRRQFSMNRSIHS